MKSSHTVTPVQERYAHLHAARRNLRNPLIVVVLIIVLAASCTGRDHSFFGSDVHPSTSLR